MSRPQPAQTFSVGFVLFVATLLVVGAVFWVGSGRGVFSSAARYHALFPSATGLTAGSKVFLSGVPVGTVEKIGFLDDLEIKKVRVTLRIDSRVAPRVRRDSTVWLQTEGLLGDNTVHIAIGTGSEPELEPGSEIPVRNRTMLEDLAGKDITDSTTALLRSMIGILTEMQKGEGTLGQLLKNPELYDNLNSFVASLDRLGKELHGVSGDVQALMSEIRSQRGLLGKVLLSGEYEQTIARALEETTTLIARLNRIAEVLDRGEGTAGRLLTDSTFHDGAVRALEGVTRLAGNVDRVLSDARASRSVLGRVLTDPEMGERLASALGKIERSAKSVETVLRLLEEGEGSLGMLLHDPSIAVSLRNVFYGVQEAGYVLSLVRNAELEGRELEIRDDREAARALREAGRVRSGIGSGAAVEGESRETPAVLPEKNES